MTNYTDIAKRQAQHVLIYGEPKSGKSTLIAELLDQGFKLLWFSMDNGHDVIGKLPIEAQKRCEIIVLPDTKQFPVAMGTILKAITGEAIQICEYHGQVDCTYCKKANHSFSSVCLNEIGLDTVVVYDHLTQLTRSVESNIANARTEKNASVDEFTKFEFDQWDRMGKILNKVLGNLQQAQYHLVAAAHVLEAEQEDGKKKLFPLVGTRNFSSTVPGFFDHIVYTHLQSGTHKFGSASTYMASVSTGSRKDIAIENMDKLSLKPFFDGTVGAAPIMKGNGASAASSVLLAKNNLVEQKVSAPGINAQDLLARLRTRK